MRAFLIGMGQYLSIFTSIAACNQLQSLQGKTLWYKDFASTLDFMNNTSENLTISHQSLLLPTIRDQWYHRLYETGKKM